MHSQANKKHDIEYTAQPPRKRRGFLLQCILPEEIWFYLTRFNSFDYILLIIKSSHYQIITLKIKSSNYHIEILPLSCRPK